jgi:hypothetical protein
MYTENIRIYRHFVVIYRMILYRQSLLIVIIRSVDLSYKSSEQKTWKAAPKNAWTRCATPTESSITPATPNKHMLSGSKNILFHQKSHPKEMGTGEVQTFLTHLALEEHISVSMQNQALSALLFLSGNKTSTPETDCRGGARRSSIGNASKKPG